MRKCFFLIAAMAISAGSAWASGTSCEDLTKLNIPHVTVDSAIYYASGAFNPPPGGGPGAQNQLALYRSLSSFCRVQVTSKPTSDSDIKIEIWLPAGGWNGRMAVYGNGAFGSNIGLNNLAVAVSKGYVGTGDNTGHEGNDGSFAVGHPEKYIDWGYRAVHENVVIAKAVSAAYYGSQVSTPTGTRAQRAAARAGSPPNIIRTTSMASPSVTPLIP